MSSSIQNELDLFFKLLGSSDNESLEIDQSTFSKARRKIRHGVFSRLNDELTKIFYNNEEYNKWHGFRLVAVDGSHCQMPDSSACRTYFGENSKNKDKRYVMGRIIDFYDPLNKISLKSDLMPYSDSEHAMTYRLLGYFFKNDLMIYDRGFFSFAIMQYHIVNENQFCMRMATGSNMVKNFIASGKDEDIVIYKASRISAIRCKEQNLPTGDITLRLIRIELESGNIEILATNLYDSNIFTIDEMKKLYALRWPVEEGYKDKKAKAQLGNWTGMSVETCKQDFHAKTLTLNIVAILAFSVKEEVDEKCATRKLEYKVNWMEAIRKIRHNIILLFQAPKVAEIIEYLRTQFIRNLTPVRPNRVYPRSKSKRRVKFSMGYKNIS